jgi:hypothetical protein
MLDFSPTKPTESVTYPGERFVTRRIGPALRASTELKLSAERAKLRDIQERFFESGTALDELVKASPMDDDGKPLLASDPSLITPEMLELSKQRTALDEEYTLFNTANVKPAWIRAGFVSLESAPNLTADELLSAPYPDLIEEIYQTIYNGAYIQPEQAKT